MINQLLDKIINFYILRLSQIVTILHYIYLYYIKKIELNRIYIKFKLKF